ncbi:hypothetical protein L596_000321 [Steinernema carpocapsae]|uniref:SGS domain-containing protein n=1 Tax=Steinernema carpocapsae TaxID=34508 RepID=A0A4U8UIM3_STECR|nr:hypothetical protein L596_000321 [Steinernema carpocapsae]
MTVSASKPRYEWFQTSSLVTLTIFKRGLSSEMVTATYEDEFLRVFSTDGEFFSGQLSHLVDKSQFARHPPESGAPDAEAGGRPLGPSSPRRRCPGGAPWTHDRRGQVEQDGERGDRGGKEREGRRRQTGMTKAMQALYASCDADAQRAMMKSYVESGGTVLNMNWEEVSKKKVEMSPPEMEFKKYGR